MKLPDKFSIVLSSSQFINNLKKFYISFVLRIYKPVVYDCYFSCSYTQPLIFVFFILFLFYMSEYFAFYFCLFELEDRNFRGQYCHIFYFVLFFKAKCLFMASLVLTCTVSGHRVVHSLIYCWFFFFFVSLKKKKTLKHSSG